MSVVNYAADALVRVDPATRRVVARIDATRNAVAATVTVGAWALAIAVAGDDVWVRGGSARADGGLFRIDARTNTVTLVAQAGAPQGREGVASIAATDRGVWVPGVSLDFVDRETGAVTATLPISSYAVALDADTLWLLDVFGHLERRAMPR